MFSQRVLVTGGSGFIGTNLVRRLLDEGRSVVNVDVDAPRDRTQHDVWTRCDVTDRQSLQGVFERFRPHAVIHLAARTDLGGSAVRDYHVNFDGVAAVAGAVKETDSVQRVVVASSRLVCRIG